MKIALRTAGAVALAVLALSGCRTLFGRGHGPIDSFAFLPEHNPGLNRPVTGIMNELSEPKTIEMVVPPGTDASHLVATISLNTTATIQVISSGSPVTQTNSQTPNDFQSPVLYSVTTSKDKEPWQYRVLVRPADTNAKLAQLSVAGGSTLQPQFDPSGTSFSTTVPYAATQVRIDARAQSAHLQQMTIGGQNVRGVAGTVTLPFSGTDRLDVPITATAEDQTTEAHYTLTVLRGQPDRNSSLDALRVDGSAISPAFSPGIVGYTAQVPYNARSVQVAANPQSSVASVSLAQWTSQNTLTAISVRGNVGASSGATVDFTATDHLSLAVVVTAQDGSTSQYTVNIVRAQPDHNNSLANLDIGDLSLNPSFDPTRLHYTVEAPYASQQLTLHAFPQSQVASVAIIGAASGGNPSTSNGAVIQFSGADRIPLDVKVTAQDGSTLDYTLDVRRGAPDNNSNLANIIAVPGQLNPLFSPRTVAYNLVIPGSSPSATITVQTASPYASVSASGNGVSQNGSGPSGEVISIPVSPNETRSADIVVTAQDGSQRLYRVSVTRPGLPQQPAPKDTNAKLSGIVVAGGQLMPAFSPEQLSYSVNVPTSQNRLTLFPIAQSPVARVAVDGSAVGSSAQSIDLQPGSPRIVVITVVAESGASSRYTVSVTRALPPSPPAGGGPGGGGQQGQSGGPQGNGPGSQGTGGRGEAGPGQGGSNGPGQQGPGGNNGNSNNGPGSNGPGAGGGQPGQGNGQSTGGAQGRGGSSPLDMTTVVKATGVRIDPHVWKAVRDANDSPGNQATITIRAADTNQVLGQGTVSLDVRQPGNSPAELSFAWNAPVVHLTAGQQVAITVDIKTAKGKYLVFTETDKAGATLTVNPDSFTYSDSP